MKNSNLTDVWWDIKLLSDDTALGKRSILRQIPLPASSREVYLQEMGRDQSVPTIWSTFLLSGEYTRIYIVIIISFQCVPDGYGAKSGLTVIKSNNIHEVQALRTDHSGRNIASWRSCPCISLTPGNSRSHTWLHRCHTPAHHLCSIGCCSL